jgi:hypothetical protein
MQLQLGQHLAGMEAEVADHPGSFLRRGVVRARKCERQGKDQKDNLLHGSLLKAMVAKLQE